MCYFRKEIKVDKGDAFVLFIGGFIIGMFTFGALLNTFDPIRIESVEDLKSPEKMFKITIDDVVFTCSLEGSIVGNKAVLFGCEETRGRKLVIKNFDSFSVEMITTQ